MKKLIAFSWYGGKFSHLNSLLPIIENANHNSFIEPYGGSAAILLNKSLSKIEVYNDINSEVVNFFQVLRNEPNELINLIKLTPYSRKEFELSIKNDSENKIEKARCFFVKARQCFSGLATIATVGKWSTSTKDSRRGISSSVSRWLSSIENLAEIAERLKLVQIENLPAIEIIKKYDTKESLFYIDPPYLLTTRSGGKAYKNEMEDSDHIELLQTLKKINGKAIISGYYNNMYTNMLTNWNKKEFNSKKINVSKHNFQKKNKEIIWTNFEIGV